MERFSVKGLDLATFYSPETKLARVFRDIESDLEAEKKVVCQYIINGYSVSEEEESYFSTLMIKDVEIFEYLAEDRWQLVEGVIEVWRGAIPEMIQRWSGFAESEFKTEGNGFLDQVLTLIQSMESIEQNLGDMWLSATSWGSDLYQLRKFYFQIQILVKNKEWTFTKSGFHRKFLESLRMCLKSFVELDTLLKYGNVPARFDSLDCTDISH
jgi:hypothetical protein